MALNTVIIWGLFDDDMMIMIMKKTLSSRGGDVTIPPPQCRDDDKDTGTPVVKDNEGITGAGAIIIIGE